MKLRYIFAIGLLIILAVIFEIQLFKLTKPDDYIGNAIQSAAVFVALMTAIVALSAADPKEKMIDVTIDHDIDLNSVGSYNKNELPKYLQEKYAGFQDLITSHRVQFKIKNTSKFTLRKPTLTFKLPLEKRHLNKKEDGSFNLSFNSNLYNTQTELRVLEFGDTQILSNSNLPFWNNDESITIWIRMLLNDGILEPFIIQISVNSENAEGVTKIVQINPTILET